MRSHTVYRLACIAALLAAPIQADPDIAVSLPDGAEMDFIWVEPGEFIMGITPAQVERFGDYGFASISAGDVLDVAQPSHKVTITEGFYLGRTEITHGQWKSVMGEDQGLADDMPVAMEWDELNTFIASLNEAAGDSLFRLPTEAEWEYACRAGTTSLWSHFPDDAWEYFGGSVPLGRFMKISGWKDWETNVAQYDPNPWGFYDMHGNIQEWVQDYYSEYTQYWYQDPRGPETGSARVWRGGGPMYNDITLQPVARTASPARNRSDAPGWAGARLVRLATPLNRPPRADAGSNQLGRLGDTFTVDASASIDPDGVPLTFSWIEDPRNPETGIVLDPTSAATTVRPTVPGDFRFQVTVSDGEDTTLDSVEIRVAPLAVSQPASRVIRLDLWGSGPQDFVWIEPGTYDMGLTREQEDYLRATGGWGNWVDGIQQVHSVTITHGFYMSIHEITRRQWTGAMGSTPWRADTHVDGAIDDRPATRISWHDVQGFIDIQNQAIGGEVFRLPTEAEWEFAYRAGATTIWPWGDNRVGEVLHGWPVGDLHVVGTKLANAWGLYDMVGNAGEWCHDSFQTYSAAPRTNPVGTGSDQKMIRGTHIPALRLSADPGYTNIDIGARLIAWGPDLTSGIASESWGEIKKAFQAH